MKRKKQEEKKVDQANNCLSIFRFTLPLDGKFRCKRSNFKCKLSLVTLMKVFGLTSDHQDTVR